MSVTLFKSEMEEAFFDKSKSLFFRVTCSFRMQAPRSNKSFGAEQKSFGANVHPKNDAHTGIHSLTAFDEATSFCGKREIPCTISDFILL